MLQLEGSHKGAGLRIAIVVSMQRATLSMRTSLRWGSEKRVGFARSSGAAKRLNVFETRRLSYDRL